MTNKAPTEQELRNWILSLPPDSVKNLEDALRSIREHQYKGESTSQQTADEQSAIKIKSEETDDIDVSPPSRTLSPTSSNVSVQSKTKSGKTYENGRRNLKEEEVSEEEAHRRAKRRERNRLAAAKCRKRRQDKIETLQQKVAVLKAEIDDLNSTIERNIVEKEKLDKIITTHTCNLRDTGVQNQNSSNSATRPTSLKLDKNHSDNQTTENNSGSSCSSNVFICSLSPQLINLSPLLTPQTMKLLLETITTQQSESLSNNTLKDEPPHISIDSSFLSSVTTPTSFSRSLSLLNLMSPNSDLLNMNLLTSSSLKVAASLASSTLPLSDISDDRRQASPLKQENQ